MKNNDYLKVLKKINTLIKKAKGEKNNKGYRENIGYDSQLELENYMSTLNLSYQERAELIKMFYQYCDELQIRRERGKNENCPNENLSV